MKRLFTLDWLSRSSYTIWMILSVAIAFFSYMILVGFLMGWVDVARIIIAVPASCVLIMIYFITRRLIDVYKYLGVWGLFYFFILYSLFSYDSMLHDWVANVNWFIYYMIWIALAFLLAFVPKLWTAEDSQIVQIDDWIHKYKTTIQIIFLIILASIIPNVLIKDKATMYQVPGTIQKNTNIQKDISIPTQNYWSYLDNNTIKPNTTNTVKEQKKDNTIYIHIPNK